MSRWACGTIFSALCIIACPFSCLVVVCHGVNNISVDEGMEVFPSPWFSFSSTESCTRISSRLPMLTIFQSHTGETVADIPHEIHVVRDQNKSFVHSIKGLEGSVLSIVGILERWFLIMNENVCPFHGLVMTVPAMISCYVAIISKTS